MSQAVPGSSAELVGGGGAPCTHRGGHPWPLSSTPASRRALSLPHQQGLPDLCLLTHQGHVNCSCRGAVSSGQSFTCQGEERDQGTAWRSWAQMGTISPQTLQQPSTPTTPAPKPQFLAGEGYRRSSPSSGKLPRLSPAVNSSCRAQDEFECANASVSILAWRAARRLPLQGQV